MSCRRYVKWMDRLAENGEPRGDSREVYAHLATCPSCARYYNRVVLVLRQLQPVPGEVSPAELAFIGDAVVSGLRTRQPRGWGLRTFVALVATASVAGLTLFVLPATRPGPGEVQSRGEAGAVDADLRAYCLRQQGDDVMVVSVSDPLTGRLSCGLADAVQFAYRLRAPDAAWLYIVGLDQDGRLLEYQPRPPAQTSLPIARHDGEQVLSGSVRLGVNHHAGTVRVIGLVSSEPLTQERVRSALSPGASPSALPAAQRLTLSLELSE